jgi:N-acetylglucosaminyl-diphospho-decaprenol L-rhamnosyltransferase
LRIAIRIIFRYVEKKCTIWPRQDDVEASLSIVIVNWNTRDLLLDCLTSIHAHASQYELVVVDNGSTDGSAAAVQREYPDVKTISHTENQGYARANMIGFRATNGPYVLFLNSDTIIQSDAVTCLIDFLEREPQCAACGPRLVQPDGKTQPFAFGNDPKLGYLLARASARIGIRAPLHDWESTAVQAVDWISGACLLVRRSAFEQVGGFDERIFMYFEDNDLCLRLRSAGWQVVYDPLVAITHTGGASLSSCAHRREYYYRSLLYFYSKHYSSFDNFILRILLPLYKWSFG